MRHYKWAGKMIINQKPNIIYNDIIGHKRKSLVTTDKLSNNKYNQTPLMRESKDISFKGVSFKDAKQAFSFFAEKNYNLKQNIDFLKRYLGKAPVDLDRQTSSWSEIGKFIQKSQDKTSVTIKEKQWFRLLLEAMAYPVTDLPFHLLHSAKKTLMGDKAAKEGQKAASSVSRFIKSKFDTLNNTDIVNSFIGYMDTAEKYKYDTNKMRSSGMLTNALKMFDPKSGNYNAVHERALTRIVTGFIPAFFLANDAYNLSRLCDDDPQKADKERKLRFNQETKRVLSNAYLQLITLGALSKWINKSKATFIGVTALSVLLTESFSRLSNGKKLHMINKQEAIEMNKKEGLLPADYKEPSAEVSIQPAKSKISNNPAFKGSKVFQGFGLATDMPLTQATGLNMSGKKERIVEVDNAKPLLTLSSIVKWFAVVVTLGFALKHVKGIKISENVKIKDYFDVISKKYDKIYDSLTKQDYKLSRTEFNKIINKLKEYDGEVIGPKFEKIINNFQKTEKVKSISGDFAKVLKEAGLNSFAQKFEHIANAKKNNSFKDIPLYNKAQGFIKARNNKIIKHNLVQLFAIMKKENNEELALQLRQMLFDINGKLDTSQFNKAKKILNKNAKQYAATFENRFKVDEQAENLKLFYRAINKLQKIDAAKAAEYKKLVEDAAKADTVYMGKKNIPGVREFADFITEPFKFIWGTITLPYKHIAKPFSKVIKPEVNLPKWPKEIDAVSTTIQRLTHKPLVKLPSVFGSHKGIAKIDYNADDFAKYMNLQFDKAHNTATMSSLSNSDLSALAKNTSTAATAWFLMTDNHNMVMQKSNGQDKPKAIEKAKERAIQETSRTFYNVMFINWFNNTFRHVYNSSLFGAQTVNTASTLVGEFVNRKAIGMPVTPQTRDQILNKEYENITSKGLKGKFFRFMSRLTGKKVLSQRENKTK